MATIRAYTTIEQSKKLAEILPLESADAHYWCKDSEDLRLGGGFSIDKDLDIPAWSVTALLELLDYPQLSKDKLGGGKVGWMISVYPDNYRYDSCWHDNPVDACYEMIIRLNELKML